MATVKKTYVKLGEQANSFSCPTTGLKVLPGRIVELSTNQEKSLKVKTAIKNSHLEKVTETDYEEFLAGVTDYEEFLAGVTGNDNPDADNDGKVFYTEAELTKKGVGKPELISIAIKCLTDDSEENEESLRKLSKPELVDFILENQDEEEEE